MANATVEPVGARVSQWGEGPIWWEDRLLYVDIEDHKVVRLDPAKGSEEVWDVDERVGMVVPRRSGGFVIAGDNGIAFFDPENGEKRTIADPEADKRPDNRFNDGKCDPAGRLWTGTISLTKTPRAARLYMLDAELKLHHRLAGVTNSNGLAWSADAKTMYFIDTPKKKVEAFRFNNDRGEVLGRSVVIDTAAAKLHGSPDGMTIDSDDHLWIALCHGGAVVRVNPATGKVVDRIDFPCVETTSCAFGGANLDILFVTTGLKEGTDEEGAGKVFAVTGLGVRGVATTPFGG